ncbi:alkaline phosphatase PhoX [Methylocucumis oryzae]|uniref:alkaline phosphatase PhoX n=1 Tax=Methylocucumis oryzae TaxID=1632867 RepID=UPI0006990690|nr:alkaline phosphatase PhoX [Methylocucumis oryzae]
MSKPIYSLLTGAVVFALSQSALAGTNVFFNPLTQSTAVASTANHINELNTPLQVPAGVSQTNLLSLSKVEADTNQSILRVPAGTSSSMLDMSAFSDDGRFLFLPHETPFGAGLSRYDFKTKKTALLFAGDQKGAEGDWTNDYGAFDPARFTPNGTVIVAEEWAGQGRVIEVLNPFAKPADIQKRELESIANVSHEGINFSEKYNNVIYYIDEWNSGSIYKFVMTTPGDYTKGQTFVLKVDAFNGVASDLWNDASNASAPRTGAATWVALTDADGNPVTTVSAFKNGEPETDPRVDLTNALGGRAAADEVGATPFGRPEDMEVAKLANGNEVLYIAMTSEAAIYAVEILDDSKATVRIFANNTNTPKNLNYPATTAVLNSPDNLAQDALGNIYIIEDAPNSSTVGGDIWFIRDVNNDGTAESIDHFMSIQVNGSEATGMIFNPAKPTQFVVSVQHPSSTDLAIAPTGFGDAVWLFDLENVVPPTCVKKVTKTCQVNGNSFAHMLKAAGN